MRSFAERQGQAMVDVFRFFLDHQDTKLGKRHRPHVNLTIHLPDLTAKGPGRTTRPDGQTTTSDLPLR